MGVGTAFEHLVGRTRSEIGWESRYCLWVSGH